MRNFNVLDASLNIHQHYLLEASAGTGKTFSIENIVVRLLIEGESPPSLEQILIMTFTKAAAGDLKARIRNNIEQAVSELNAFLNNPDSREKESKLPYLALALEQGKDAIALAKRRLEEALFCFTDASIFTLHAFCSRLLRENIFESDLSLESMGGDENLPESEMRRIVKDFFLTGLKSPRYSSAELELVLTKGMEKLEKSIYQKASGSIEIIPGRSFAERLEEFNRLMTRIQSSEKFSAQLLAEDYEKLAPCFKEITDRSKKLSLKQLSHFEKDVWEEDDFALWITHGFLPLKELHPDKRYKKGGGTYPDSLHYPHFLNVMELTLAPLLQEACSKESILARMAHDCREILKKRLDEQEKMTFDDLLSIMARAVRNPSFSQKIRTKYRAAIIDEFQDTDPVQWEIFRHLFLDEGWNGHLYIVGDPKQSIYGFRRADIYSYLSAAEALGKDHQASLSVNYRSQPTLIAALNALFSEENVPGFIALPKRGSSLCYQPVEAGSKTTEIDFADGKKALHFFSGPSDHGLKLEKTEKEHLLPFISREIHSLHTQHNIPFNDFALLVADQFQARRAATFLRKLNIPATLQRSSSLADSSARTDLCDLLKGVLAPHDESLLKAALGCKIMGWNDEQIIALSDQTLLENALIEFHGWRKLFIEHGFIFFFDRIYQRLTERLLKEEGGIDYLNELSQLAEVIVDEQNEHQLPFDEIVPFLESFDQLKADEESRLSVRNDPSQQAVKIVTIHSSKGLEYSVVFALGLIKRPKIPELIFPIEHEEQTVLKAVTDREAPEYLKYCEELDAEKARQFYVALTRAKHRLYVPLHFQKKKNGSGIDFGAASPMELFLARLGPLAESYATLYERIQEGLEETFISFIDSHTHFSFSREDADSSSLTELSVKEKVKLIAPPSFGLHGVPFYLHSFTALSKHAHSATDDVMLPPRNFSDPNKTVHTLPSSSDTGTLLHTIFEHIPFDTQDISSFIAPYLKSTPYEAWNAVITEIIHNALHVELDGFPLKDIRADCCYRETEFLYPCANVQALEEIACPPGYIKGVIDLLFLHNGKYYLLDWKTNWLGPDLGDYHQQNLDKAMESHQYSLQAAIYEEAARRYLALIDDRPFEEIFGGTFYLFLRGIDLKEGSNTGVKTIRSAPWKA